MEFSTARIDDIVSGDEELKNELISLFMQTMEKCIANLESGIGQADSEKIWHDEMHELKGSALNLGFNDLAEYCKKYEYEKVTDSEKTEAVEKLKSIYDKIKDGI